MEAQENRHKRAREPDGDSDSTSESGLESSKTEELTPTPLWISGGFFSRSHLSPSMALQQTFLPSNSNT